jgi:NAD(P)-dependent dehydrogenase (short-subunit alcohol dehydrogenase family)
MFRLDGRVAFVTGAARGIGFAVGRKFLAAGATVTFSDVDERGLQAASERLRSEATDVPERTFFAVADSAAATSVLIAAHARSGRLDILVDNAGLGDAAEFLDLDMARLRRVMDINGGFLAAGIKSSDLTSKNSGG